MSGILQFDDAMLLIVSHTKENTSRAEYFDKLMKIHLCCFWKIKIIIVSNSEKLN